MATSLIEICGQKLRKEFNIRNVRLQEASQECGFTDCYFSRVCSSNKISKPAIALLERLYNIRYEDYRLDTEDVSEPEETGMASPLAITESVLHDIIYSAVYEAMKRALSE